MLKNYQQLSYEQRCQIQALKASGMSNRQIALQLGVHSTTIDREIKRNSTDKGYFYEQAEEKSKERKKKRAGVTVKMTPDRIIFVEEKLTQEQWSPEQISGWLKREGSFQISYEWIYQYIWADKEKGGSLYQNLRRKARKYQKRVNGKTNRGRIIGRVDIDQRPAIVEERSRIGDWEADTIVGLGHKSALVSLVERKTRYTKLFKVASNTAELVKQAISISLSPHKDFVFTITFDNGKEFAYHQEVGKELEAETYFAKPYHSWERGLNENTNGLVRQYFPKKTDFTEITDEQVAQVEYLLNNRPRKCLGFNTPAKAFHSAA